MIMIQRQQVAHTRVHNYQFDLFLNTIQIIKQILF